MENQLTINQVIKKEAVFLDVIGVQNKEQLFKKMIGGLFLAGIIDSEEKFAEAIQERESMGPTYMGKKIAIPHGKGDTVNFPACAFARLDSPIYYDSPFGGGEIDLCFMLAVPGTISGPDYMRVLARLARLLVYDEFLSNLYQAKNFDDVLNTISQYERKLT